MHEGGRNCLKYLKRGWNRKEWRGNKDFKRGGRGQAGSRGVLKREAGDPLTNYVTCKKIDIFNIKNQILLSIGFIFDLGIIAT